MCVHCFKNYFFTDIRRLLKSYRWLAGSIGVAMALFWSLEDQLFQKGFINGNVLSTYVSSTLMTGSLIAYAFCAFPFAGIYPEDWEHKYIRYGVIRGNLKAYVAAKTIVIYISSLGVMLFGTLLFLSLCRTQIPWTDWNLDQYGIELSGCYGNILQQGYAILYCGLYSLNMGLVAGVLSNMAALCSVFISNTVLVYIFPVLAFRVLVSVNINGYNIYSFYAYVKIFANDWTNLLFLSVISVMGAALSAVGCYFGLKRKL